MKEKELIERDTAEKFVDLLNRQSGTSFRVVAQGDAPDAVARDDGGRILSIEIVMTEDRPGDIKAMLGRSDSRSLANLRRHVEAVRLGKEQPQASELSGNVAESLLVRLRAKMLKRYGTDVALVVRDTSGVDWDWDLEIPGIQAAVARAENPFDRGIWLVSKRGDRLFEIASCDRAV